MNGESILISSAMLNAQYELNNHDVFDSILPFAKCYIEDKISTNKEIKPLDLASSLSTEFGFTNFPEQACSILFKRLVKENFVIRRNNKYYRSGNDCSDLNHYKIERKSFEDKCSTIGNDFANFLNKSSYPEIKKEEALEYLYNFFDTYGLKLYNNSPELDLIASAHSFANRNIEFETAQYIIGLKENNPEYFEIVLEILKSFFVSSSIYFRLCHTESPAEYFEETNIYFDTPILLEYLGYKTREAKLAALKFVNMIKDKKGKIYVFEHTVSEIKRILSAYKYSLMRPGEVSSSLTLEGLDFKQFSYKDVENEIASLEFSLKKSGISIFSPSRGDNQTYGNTFNDFADYIGNGISYSNDEALNADVASILLIAALRGNRHKKTLENCGHIFVTTNTRLAKLSDEYFQNQDIQYVFTEALFSALLWINSSDRYADYPKIKLLQNAAAALSLTPEVEREFLRQLEILKNKGEITQEESRLLQSDHFVKNELMFQSKGNKDNLSEIDILALKDKYRLRLIESEVDKTTKKYEAQKALDKRAQKQTERKYTEKINTLTQEKQELTREIEKAKNYNLARYIKNEGLKTYNFWKKLVNTTFIVVFTLLLIINTLFIINSFINNSFHPFCIIINTIGLILSVLGAWEFLISKFKFTGKISENIARHFQEKKIDSLNASSRENTKD